VSIRPYFQHIVFSQFIHGNAGACRLQRSYWMNTTHPYRALTSRFLSIVIFSGALAASGALFAQPAAGNGAPPKPPAEALAAC
jgi:hypothetical protein